MTNYSMFEVDKEPPTQLQSRFKERRGIGVQPSKEEPESDSWRDTFMGLLKGYFGDEEEAKIALTKAPEQPSYDMDEALETLKSVNLPSRISEPVIEGAPEKFSMPKPEPFELEVDTIGNEALDRNATRLVDVTDTEEGKLSNEEALFEMGKQIREETIKTEGLMSKRDDDSADGVQPTDGKDFKIPEYKVYESPDEMSELEILARTIEAEAALEPYKGKIAVGATIANRAASGSYGKDIRGVILRRGQFSPWNSWTGYAKGEQGKNMMKLKASEDSYKAANAILTGNYEDPTDGATHYVNEKVSKPAWLGDMKGRKRGTLNIGNHLFGNADSNEKYDGKSWILDRSSETTDQPVEAAPVTVKAIQRIIGTTADGDFGPASRKKAIEYLADKGVDVDEDAENKTLMRLVVGS